LRMGFEEDKLLDMGVHNEKLKAQLRAEQYIRDQRRRSGSIPVWLSCLIIALYVIGLSLVVYAAVISFP